MPQPNVKKNPTVLENTKKNEVGIMLLLFGVFFGLVWFSFFPPKGCMILCNTIVNEKMACFTLCFSILVAGMLA